MPNIKSAIKRVNVIQKKHERNRIQLSEMKTAIKKISSLIEINDIASAEKMLPSVYAIIDANVSKGIIHVNNAANKKSSIAKRISDVKSGKLVMVIKKDNKAIAAEKAKFAQETRKAAKVENDKKKLEREKLKAEEAKKVDAKKKEKPVAASKDKAAKDVKGAKPGKVEAAKPAADKSAKAESAKAAKVEADKPAKEKAAKPAKPTKSK